MSVIVKCDPPVVDDDGRCSVEVKTFGNSAPRVGETVYVWTSETRGGTGLEMFGEVRGVQLSGRLARMDISISKRLNGKILTKKMLEVSYQNDVGGHFFSLSKKLYRHSLNKVADLDGDEEIYLAACRT